MSSQNDDPSRYLDGRFCHFLEVPPSTSNSPEQSFKKLEGRNPKGGLELDIDFSLSDGGIRKFQLGFTEGRMLWRDTNEEGRPRTKWLEAWREMLFCVVRVMDNEVFFSDGDCLSRGLHTDRFDNVGQEVAERRC